MDNCYNSAIIRKLEAREDTRDFADAVKTTLQKWNDTHVTLRIPHHFEVVIVGARGQSTQTVGTPESSLMLSCIVRELLPI